MGKKYDRETTGFVFVYRGCLVMMFPVTIFMACCLDLMGGYKIGTTLYEWWYPDL